MFPIGSEFIWEVGEVEEVVTDYVCPMLKSTSSRKSTSPKSPKSPDNVHFLDLSSGPPQQKFENEKKLVKSQPPPP